MEKLSNQQIDAIAYDLKDKIQAHNKLENDKNRKIAYSNFYKTKAGKIHKLYHVTFKIKIPINGLDNICGFKSKIEYIDLSIIRNKVILATIDCKDYKELSDKLLKELL